MGFQRKQITLPDTAGETVRVDIKGFAVIVEKINLYSDIDEVPLMYFDSEGTREQPLYPQSKYASANRFKRLVFKATDESESDTVNILVTDACIEPDINITLNVEGKSPTAGTTFEFTASDTAEKIPLFQLADSEGNLPRKILITARNNPFVWAIDTDPDQTDFGNLVLHKDETSSSEREADALEVIGAETITKLTVINAINGSNSKLIINPTY